MVGVISARLRLGPEASSERSCSTALSTEG